MDTYMKKTGRALALAVALALTSSTGFAMPTGGTVAAGEVTGLTDGTVESGATIKTQGASIINWEAFGLKAGESLTLDTTYGALLNRVTGGNISEIYGTLTQTGSNMALLVNPSGIIVGETGVINSQNLTLSTLTITDDSFTAWMNGTGTGTLQAPDGKTIAEPVKFEKGAAVNETTVVDRDEFQALGGTIEVADGVSFTSTGNRPGLSFVAAQSYAQTYGSEDDQRADTMEMAMSPTNAITFSGSVDATDTTNESYLNFIGGAVTLDGAKIELSDHDKTSYSSEIDIAAVNQVAQVAGDQDMSTLSRTAANTVTLTNSTLKADGIYIVGGALKNTKTSITVGEDGFNTYIASGSATMIDSLTDRELTETGNTANSLVESATNRILPEDADGASAAVTVEGTPTDENPTIEGAATSADAANASDASASSASNAASSTGAAATSIRAAAASAAAVLGGQDAAASATLQQNAAQGYQAMSSILGGTGALQGTALERMTRTADLVRMIDEDPDLDESAKTAQAYGMIRAIDDNGQMSDEEKRRLKKMVARNFRSLSSDIRTHLMSIAQTAAQRNA